MKKVRMMWKVLAVVALAGLLASCGDTKQTENKAPKDTIQVGVVQIMEHQALDDANRGFVDAVKAAKLGKPVEFIQQNAQGDQSNLKTIAQGFVTRKVDMIAAISTPAAQAAANETQTIPIVGTAISDYEVAKLVETNEKPNTNVTGTSDYTSGAQQIAFIQEMFPQAKRLGLIYNSGEVNSQLQADEIKEEAAKAGLDVVEVTVTSVNDIQQVAQSLAGAVDVVYVPTDNVIASAMATLIDVTNRAKIPVIGAAGTMVKDGAVASLSVDYYRLGYAAGEMAAKILKGEATPQTTPVAGQKDLGILINAAQVKNLGIVLPESVQRRATMQ